MKIDKYIKSLPLVVLLSLFGCSKYGSNSTYHQDYETLLKTVSIPSTENIQNEGVAWEFPRPIEEVWPACLHVVSQYEGIVGMDTANAKEKRILFIHGQEIVTGESMVYGRFHDVWIAVSLSSGPTQNTLVAAAPVLPGDHKAINPAAFSPDTKQKNNPAKKQEVSSVPYGMEHIRKIDSLVTVGSAFATDNQSISMQLGKTKNEKKVNSLIPQATINEFYYALGTQLYGPTQWKTKFQAGRDVVRMPRKMDNVKYNSIEKKKQDLEIRAGNWTSAKLRRSFVQIDCPETEAMFTTTINNLSHAAGKPNAAAKLFIIASPEVNAFALPNGHIFLCSGLLEMTENEDEVAAVLGHELDHYFQHDTIERLESIEGGKSLQTALVIGGSVAGGAIMAAQAASAAAAGTATSTSTSLTTQLTTQSLTSAAQLAGQTISSTMIQGYSQKCELRADCNGAKYLWAAGYDVNAELKLLNKLSDYQKDVINRKENIASGLVNCKPGPAKRMEEMQKVIAGLH